MALDQSIFLQKDGMTEVILDVVNPDKTIQLLEDDDDPKTVDESDVYYLPVRLMDKNPEDSPEEEEEDLLEDILDVEATEEDLGSLDLKRTKI